MFFWLANRPAKWGSPPRAMFFRLKPSGPRTYLQIVENRRQDGVHRQHVIATLGRADELAASGALASLLASGARLCDQVMLLSALERDAEGLHLSTRRIGGPLLFGRLWEQTGCEAVIKELLAGRGFELDVERAIFATVLHRLSPLVPTGPATSGSRTTPSRARTSWRCTTSTAPWPGSERSWTPGTAAGGMPHPSPRAASRTRSRRRCSRAGATCSASSPSCSWTPPRSASKARAGRRSGSGATQRTTGPT